MNTAWWRRPATLPALAALSLILPTGIGGTMEFVWGWMSFGSECFGMGQGLVGQFVAGDCLSKRFMWYSADAGAIWAVTGFLWGLAGWAAIFGHIVFSVRRVPLEGRLGLVALAAWTVAWIFVALYTVVVLVGGLVSVPGPAFLTAGLATWVAWQQRSGGLHVAPGPHADAA